MLPEDASEIFDQLPALLAERLMLRAQINTLLAERDRLRAALASRRGGSPAPRIPAPAIALDAMVAIQ